MPRSNKRDRLVQAASELAHHKGLHKATIAAIAERAQVPTGNVYYYFKAKTEITDAVIDTRRATYQSVRDDIDAAWVDPIDRLVGFVRFTSSQADDLAQYGCPVGGLCAELARDQRPHADRAADVLRDTIDWMAGHLREAGHPSPADEATRLVAGLQGATLLAHAMGEPDLISRHADATARELRDGLGHRAEAAALSRTDRLP